MRLEMAALALMFLVSTGKAASAVTVCNTQGLGVELEKFHVNRCDGALDYSEAIDCVNRLAEAEEKERLRAAAAIAQAECLCGVLNEVVDGYGSYSTLKGVCSVER